MLPDLDQIQFEFSGNDEKEFLSGKPKPANEEKKAGNKKSRQSTEETIEPLKIPEDAILNQKTYYSIGEVAEMFSVNSSLLRYWESEFGMQLRKNRKGDRFFQPSDIKMLLLIHDLLKRRKFTIEGAREYLKKNRNANEKYELIRSLQNLKDFLTELKAQL